MKGLRSFRALITLVCAILVSNIRADSNNNTLWDAEADGQIRAIINSNAYINQEIPYSYEGKKWDLRVIHSPNNEVLTSGSGTFFCPFYLIAKEAVPSKLFSHLEELGEKFLEPGTGAAYVNNGYFSGDISCFGILQPNTRSTYYINSGLHWGSVGINDGGMYVNNGSHWGNLGFPGPLRQFNNDGSLYFKKTFIITGKFFCNGGFINENTSFEFLANPDVIASSLQAKIPEEISSPCPMTVALKIDDPSIDSQIEEIWESKTLVNRVFCYQLEEGSYKVRIIYNPHYSSLKATQTFTFLNKEQPFSIYWNYKYGIMIDKTAPQELIDHLSQLIKLSWYDWWYDQLKIYNGWKAKVNIGGLMHRTIPWFHFMENAQP